MDLVGMTANTDGTSTETCTTRNALLGTPGGLFGFTTILECLYPLSLDGKTFDQKLRHTFTPTVMSWVVEDQTLEEYGKRIDVIQRLIERDNLVIEMESQGPRNARWTLEKVITLERDIIIAISHLAPGQCGILQWTSDSLAITRNTYKEKMKLFRDTMDLCPSVIPEDRRSSVVDCFSVDWRRIKFLD